MKTNIKRGGKLLSLALALYLLVSAFGSTGGFASGPPAKKALAANLAMSEVNSAAAEAPVRIGDNPAGSGSSLGYVPPYIDPSYLREGTISATLAQAEVGFPSAFSILDHGMVTNTVRNQTNWGTCWAFAAVGAAESSLYPGDQTALSPRHLAYFTYHGAANPARPEDGTDGDTFHPYAFNARETAGWWHPWYEYGGNSFMANATLSRIGFQTDASVPYPERYEFFDFSKLDSYGVPALKDAYLATYGDVAEGYHFAVPYRLVDSNYLPTKDLNGNWNGDAVKKALMDGYSVSVAYASGSYNSHTLSDGSVILAQQYNGPNRVNINHAVQIVGWDDGIPKEAFQTTSGKLPAGDGGWLLRNSWGENWGMDGCFYLSYEDSSLSEACQFIASADQPYDHSYQYDGTGWSTTLGMTGNPARPIYMANVFTATSDETLKATAFYTTAHNAVYSIQVYTGLNFAGDPASGTPAFPEEQKGTQPYAGYHTVDLELPVNVEKGETFAVVVKIQNPDADNRARYASEIYPVACELDGSCDGVRCDASIRSGESFLSFDGCEWLDLAGYDGLQSGGSIVTPGNICLKAFTVDGHESKVPLQEAVDTAALESSITAAEAVKKTDAYLFDCNIKRAALDHALANARQVLRKANHTQAEVDHAKNALGLARMVLDGQK